MVKLDLFPKLSALPSLYQSISWWLHFSVIERPALTLPFGGEETMTGGPERKKRHFNFLTLFGGGSFRMGKAINIVRAKYKLTGVKIDLSK